MKKLVLVLVALLVLATPFSVMAATGVTYATGVQLQNLNATTQANVVIDFFDATGASPANSSVTDVIPANASKTYFPLNSLPANFNGSAVVSSDQQVAAITNVIGNNQQRGDSYAGFTAGATTVSLPLLFKGSYGNDTWFSVQNTGAADAHVSVVYKGGTTTCNEGPVTIKANAAFVFNQAQNNCLPGGFVGAATVTSDQPVAAVLMEVGQQFLMAYSGFTSGATNPVMPLIFSNSYNNFTGVRVQNTGGASTNVTITYTPSAGQPGTQCTETQTVAAGQSNTFGYPMPGACGTSFLGSAKVTSNSAGQALAVIVNQINSKLANASSYNAFDASKATSKVSMPLIFDRTYGLYTGISVVNMGTQATNISCAFSNSSYVASQSNVAPGAALVDVQNNKISAGYVGSAVCTATGGDAKISAIVNETKTAAADQDVLFTYPGFNF